MAEQRIFKYGENVYEDPGGEFSIDDVRKHLAQFFPELAQATHSEKKLETGETEITFAKKVGTKGATYRGSLGMSTMTITTPDWPAWIPVEERRPPAKEKVLLLFENGDMIVGTGDFGQRLEMPQFGPLTHWLPLPPRPGAAG